MTNRADALFVKNDTTINARILIVNDYRQMDLFVRFEHTEDLDITLCDACLSLLTSLRASLHMYSFDFIRGKLSVTFHPVLSASDAARPSPDAMADVHQVLNINEKVLLLNVHKRLEALRQLHVEGGGDSN